MRKLVELSDVGETPTGAEKKYILEALDRNFGCFSYDAALPSFKQARYTAPSASWGHDHCVFCWNTFTEWDDDGKGTLGWIANDPGAEVPLKLLEDDATAGKFISGSPSNVRDWVCNDCHEVVTEWANGQIAVKILNFKSIPGEWTN